MRHNRLQGGNVAARHCPSAHTPRHVLAKPKNQMLDVDVTEEAKQVALYRYELAGELYDDDQILNFSYNDITELEQEQRDEITFESWLEEMISFTKSDDTLTGSTRQCRLKCGTGQSDQAMSVLVHQPRSCAAHAAPWHPAPLGGCETCSAAVEAAKLSATKSMEVPQKYQALQMHL